MANDILEVLLYVAIAKYLIEKSNINPLTQTMKIMNFGIMVESIANLMEVINLQSEITKIDEKVDWCVYMVSKIKNVIGVS